MASNDVIKLKDGSASNLVALLKNKTASATFALILNGLKLYEISDDNSIYGS